MKQCVIFCYYSYCYCNSSQLRLQIIQTFTHSHTCAQLTYIANGKTHVVIASIAMDKDSSYQYVTNMMMPHSVTKVQLDMHQLVSQLRSYMPVLHGDLSDNVASYSCSLKIKGSQLQLCTYRGSYTHYEITLNLGADPGSGLTTYSQTNTVL